jgi:hypothetical protein
VRFFEPQPGGRAPKPVSITVDGDLPGKTVGSQPYYAHGRDFKELWPALIEKASAQWKGSYDAIGNGGNPGVVMTALTGKPSSSTSNASLKPDVLFERIKSQAAGAHPITARRGALPCPSTCSRRSRRPRRARRWPCPQAPTRPTSASTFEGHEPYRLGPGSPGAHAASDGAFAPLAKDLTGHSRASKPGLRQALGAFALAQRSAAAYDSTTEKIHE